MVQIVKKRPFPLDFPLSNQLHIHHDITKNLIKQLFLVRKKGVDGSFADIGDLRDLVHCSRFVAK
ncbi:hypothetical protein D3C85_1675900 [compost metagenome]